MTKKGHLEFLWKIEILVLKGNLVGNLAREIKKLFGIRICAVLPQTQGQVSAHATTVRRIPYRYAIELCADMVENHGQRRPVYIRCVRFFLTHSTLVSKLFFLAVQGLGALLSRPNNLEGRGAI